MPQNWLQDQAVVLFKAQNAALPVDGYEYGMRPKKRSVGPDCAFGPPERSGDNSENVSVVRSQLPAGFKLAALGPAADAAQKLLDTAIAPEGSGKIAKLLEAGESIRRGQLFYTFEYLLTRVDGKKIHNIAAITVLRGELFTLTVLTPESDWAQKGAPLRQVSDSFVLRKAA